MHTGTSTDPCWDISPKQNFLHVKSEPRTLYFEEMQT